MGRCCVCPLIPDAFLVFGPAVPHHGCSFAGSLTCCRVTKEEMHKGGGGGEFTGHQELKPMVVLSRAQRTALV